jgi:hypothetical protein
MNAATIRPTVFQNPATGEPTRTESTTLRGQISRQLSHSTGRTNGMAETESGPTTTACTW